MKECPQKQGKRQENQAVVDEQQSGQMSLALPQKVAISASKVQEADADLSRQPDLPGTELCQSVQGLEPQARRHHQQQQQNAQARGLKQAVSLSASETEPEEHGQM